MREFSSFGSFARHLERLALEGEAVTAHITKEAADLVQANAKARIGEYQDYEGPFTKWAELADSTKEERVRQGFTENDPLLRTGTLRDSIKVEAKGNEAVIGSEDEVALYQEVGTDHIPPRPFLGPALYGSKNDIAEKSVSTTVAWVSGLGWHQPRQLIKLP
jgi:HK97 gp10 family phage protein